MHETSAKRQQPIRSSPADMTFIERRIQCDFIRNPQDLLKTLHIVCRKNGFQMESLEMRNDEYIIRARRSPAPEELQHEIVA